MSENNRLEQVDRVADRAEEVIQRIGRLQRIWFWLRKLVKR